jgi:hypothetical protein
MATSKNSTPAEPVEEEVPAAPVEGEVPAETSDEASHEYHSVAEGVEARVMTDEERKSRSAES